MTSMLLALALSCGVERADVKNLADPEAVNIVPQAVSITVEELAHLTPPPYSDTNPRSDIELMTYKIDAKVIGFKTESDLDYHVVIAGSTGQTMIVEFPDPTCAPNQKVATQFEIARKHFLKWFMQPTKKYKKLRVPMSCTLIGIGFYDLLHGQTGVAPSGAELHPVKDILCNVRS